MGYEAKIRAVMGIRDSKYTLDEVVELDDAFLKSHKDDKTEDDQINQRGRGSKNRSKVLVIAKTEPQRGRVKKNKKQFVFRYVRMLVTQDSSSETINNEVEVHIDGSSKIKTDGLRGFKHLTRIVDKHISLVTLPKSPSKSLPRVHTMISNVKKNLLGINHNNIKDYYLQNYLDEFCYKTNRRYFGKQLFDRLMIASVSDTFYGKYRYQCG